MVAETVWRENLLGGFLAAHTTLISKIWFTFKAKSKIGSGVFMGKGEGGRRRKRITWRKEERRVLLLQKRSIFSYWDEMEPGLIRHQHLCPRRPNSNFFVIAQINLVQVYFFFLLLAWRTHRHTHTKKNRRFGSSLQTGVERNRIPPDWKVEKTYKRRFFFFWLGGGLKNGIPPLSPVRGECPPLIFDASSAEVEAGFIRP